MESVIFILFLQNKFESTTKSIAYLFSQKEFPGKEKRNFLINRTEHPRLAEKVRCLCVGCNATWGPPCQALVTRLFANRRRRTEGDRLAQNNSNNTNNIIHSNLTWFGV